MADIIDKLIEYAQESHPAYLNMPATTLRVMFETYKNSILVWQPNGEICGFAIYQEWPDCLNFIAIAGSSSREENLKAMLAGRHNLPNKKICYFDEQKMKVVTICQQQHPVGLH